MEDIIPDRATFRLAHRVHIRLKGMVREVIGHKHHQPVYRSVSVPDHSGKGVLLLVYGFHRSTEEEKAIKDNLIEGGDAEMNANPDASDPASMILMNEYKRKYRKQSIHFAELINAEFVETDGRKSEGLREQGLYVLCHSAMPAVMVETGYIDNPDDEAYLNSETGQNEIVASIIGRISKMKLLGTGQTIVEFKVEKQYNVPSNTLAKLVSTDLLGSKAIVFEYGNSNTYAEDNDTLKADIQGSLAQSLQPIQNKAENLINKLDSSLASINKILNPNFQKNVDRSFMSIANSLQTLEGTTQKIDALIGSQTTHINGILSNAEAVSSNLKNSTAHLTGITTNFERVSNDVANANIKQTLDNANKAMADLQDVINKINTNKGTLGLLMNDDKMYNNLKDASANLNELFIDLKAHPKRYVSFSVFGGKKD
eukprot:gene7156-7224_t